MVKSPSLKAIYLILLLAVAPAGFSQSLSPLAKRPDWSKLDAFQYTLTHDQFVSLLRQVYAPRGGWEPYLDIQESEVIVKPRPDFSYPLHFAPNRAAAKPPERYWKSKAQLPPPPAEKPLEGLKIALDPGHLGGKWAKMEERWFRIGNGKPVAEGDMTLYTAKLLATRLEGLGAKVYLTRSRSGPVTELRPGKLRKVAAQELSKRGSNATAESLKSESEHLFYRVGEIRQRARLINERIQPDLVICLHYNAEAWGDEDHPALTEVNHAHFLIAGAFSPEELAHEDQLYDMLVKLLNGSFYEELAVTDAVSRSMAAATGLPPYEYKGNNAVRVSANPYIWGRNLLASRLFKCPVIFAEPYVMNSHEVYNRAQLGQYKGTKVVGGVARESIYNEYVNGLVRGLVEYYSRR